MADSVIQKQAAVIQQQEATQDQAIHSDGGVLIIEEFDDEPPAALLWLVLVSMLALQFGLLLWKRFHKKSYDTISMVGWWVFPAAFAFRLGFTRFVLIWFVYSCMTIYILLRCMKSKLDANTPWMVYAWFLAGHRICTTMGTLGYIGILSIWFLGFIPFPGLIIQLLWYGIYFGVLSRDCAVFATETMATTMGTGELLIRSQYTCGICHQSLGTDPRLQSEGNDGQGKPVSDIMKLPCGHEFHALCMYGWTMVGKKDMCPLCKEKVSSTVFMKGRPWEGATVAWGNFLDMMRYFVVWYPVLFLGLGMMIHVFKWDVPHHVIKHVYNIGNDGTIDQIE